MYKSATKFVVTLGVLIIATSCASTSEDSISSKMSSIKKDKNGNIIKKVNSTRIESHFSDRL